MLTAKTITLALSIFVVIWASDNTEGITDSSSGCTVEEDCDYFGNDIKSIPTTDATECQEACDVMSECVAFAVSDQCWLKHTVGEKTDFPTAHCGVCTKAVTTPPNTTEPVEDNEEDEEYDDVEEIP